MLDDLRNSVKNAYEEEQAEEQHLLEQKKNVQRTPFLGLSAVQRFILAVIFFLMVAIIGVTLLIVSQKIMPPIG